MAELGVQWWLVGHQHNLLVRGVPEWGLCEAQGRPVDADVSAFKCLVRRVVEAAPGGRVIERLGQSIAFGVLDLQVLVEPLASEGGLLEGLEGAVAVERALTYFREYAAVVPHSAAKVLVLVADT